MLLLRQIMRVAFLFVLSLCFFVLSGLHYSHAHPTSQATQTKIQSIVKSQPLSIAAKPDYFFHKNRTISEVKEDFINVEEDDEEFVIARKHIELVNYFVTLAYASILVHFFNYLKNRLPFCKHLSYTSSYKYILQRVLRI
jgi:hypothetical protein